MEIRIEASGLSVVCVCGAGGEGVRGGGSKMVTDDTGERQGPGHVGELSWGAMMTKRGAGTNTGTSSYIYF